MYTPIGQFEKDVTLVRKQSMCIYTYRSYKHDITFIYVFHRINVLHKCQQLATLHAELI